MTAYEFKEAMKTDAMKEEFAALLNERNVETAEALIQAMADFAISKGCDITPDKKKSEKRDELTEDELEHAAGGRLVENPGMSQWREVIQNFYPPVFDFGKMGIPGMDAIFGEKKR